MKKTITRLGPIYLEDEELLNPNRVLQYGEVFALLWPHLSSFKENLELFFFSHILFIEAESSQSEINLLFNEFLIISDQTSLKKFFPFSSAKFLGFHFIENKLLVFQNSNELRENISNLALYKSAINLIGGKEDEDKLCIRKRG